jgi:hypothetical protein
VDGRNASHSARFFPEPNGWCGVSPATAGHAPSPPAPSRPPSKPRSVTRGFRFSGAHSGGNSASVRDLNLLPTAPIGDLYAPTMVATSTAGGNSANAGDLIHAGPVKAQPPGGGRPLRPDFLSPVGAQRAD